MDEANSVSLDYVAAAGNSKVAGKFVRHVGRRINQAPLISGQGCEGFLRVMERSSISEVESDFNV